MNSGFSGRGKFHGIGQGGLADLKFGQCLAHHFLGQASALATLAGDIGGGTDFLVAAASFIDRIADLSVGDADTKTHIHKG